MAAFARAISGDQMMAARTILRVEAPLHLALAGCARCGGVLGGGTAGTVKTRRRGELRVCPCVYRSIFRHCLAHYEKREDPRMWGIHFTRDAEYRADFEAIARRTLAEEDFDLLRWHYFWGVDWKFCCREFQIDRGSFFHAIYLMEEKLGKAFHETKPYSIWPVEEYFSGIEHRQSEPKIVNGVTGKRYSLLSVIRNSGSERQGPESFQNPLKRLPPARRAA